MNVSYLLKLRVDLRQERRLLILEEDTQRSPHVQVHDPQQSNCRRPHRRVGGPQSCPHVGDEGLHVDAVHPGTGRREDTGQRERTGQQEKSAREDRGTGGEDRGTGGDDG